MMKPRTKFLDFDARRDPKTDFYCCRCQKDMDPAKPYRMVRLVDGGAWVLHPKDEALYVSDGGDCGGHPIGNDCARKLGVEWTSMPAREGTMSGHTLAPWHLVPRANSPAPEQHFSVQSVDIDAGDYVADVWCEADGRLIAAAPNLLAALENAFVAMGRAGANADTKHPLRAAWEDARAAILKAEGK